MSKNIILGITGASGAGYGTAALEHLLNLPEVVVHLIVSEPALKLLQKETFFDLDSLSNQKRVKVYKNNVLDTSLASGSFKSQGMLIAPCSLNTAMAMSSGLADNLILRAGQVCLKEKRPLVLLLRETPLAALHLQKLATLAASGGIVMPACPSFYNSPATISDLYNQTAARSLSFFDLDFPHGFIKTYNSNLP